MFCFRMNGLCMDVLAQPYHRKLGLFNKDAWANTVQCRYSLNMCGIYSIIISPLKKLRRMCSGAISPRERKYIEDQGLAQGHSFFLFCFHLTTASEHHHFVSYNFESQSSHVCRGYTSSRWSTIPKEIAWFCANEMSVISDYHLSETMALNYFLWRKYIVLFIVHYIQVVCYCT